MTKIHPTDIPVGSKQTFLQVHPNPQELFIMTKKEFQVKKLIKQNKISIEMVVDYIVTVASPKHSNQYVTSPRSGPNLEYRYTDGRIPDHSNVNPSHHQYAYVPQPVNEVHMSRSYPFTNYDSLYSHPRPYGKQFYPESVVYRNVQPVTRVNSSAYNAVKDQSRHAQQDIYGTVKHRNTFSDYENVYDAQIDYLRAMSNPQVKNNYQSDIKILPPNSMPDTNIYGVIPPLPTHSRSKSAHLPGKIDYQNVDESIGNVSSSKEYILTLFRGKA
ncbi:tyrosine-protein phosphatase non-receptor type 12 [Caerostris extrusa]|uniref:Tyrosine-protein phosphatase non-receptor type 12 n=1 Tax=Caerostris extrusa TaxID=172846 RepID=A0AAV4WSS0_CAEEX|nr:tyrosine-protein phosphatase non-receptor type 12 [Caerostris extrusa]